MAYAGALLEVTMRLSRRILKHTARSFLAALMGTALGLSGVMTTLAADLPAPPRAFAVAAQDEPGESDGPGQEAAQDGGGDPFNNPVAVRKAYLTLLFQEVNVRRANAGTPGFDTMLDSGNEAVNNYLIELTPMMEQRRACFHGSDIMGLRAGWDYLPDFGVQNEVGGEVLACPDVAAGGFWTPHGIADGWWDSPHHFHTLYADPRPDAVACGAYNQIIGKNAFETVACITLLPGDVP